MGRKRQYVTYRIDNLLDKVAMRLAYGDYDGAKAIKGLIPQDSYDEAYVKATEAKYRKYYEW